MKKEYRAHPLMIFKLLKPFLFILIIPLLKGALQFLIQRRISGVLSFEAVCFCFILAIAVLRWRAFRLTLSGDDITVSEGVFFRKQSVISVSKLSSVQTTKNPIDAVTGAVTYRINTEAGRTGKTDFEFKLSAKDSREVSSRLYGDESRTAVKFSLYKLALLAATTSSAVTGIVISVPVINKAGKLLGIALDQMLFNEINTVSEKFRFYFPPVVNVITLIFLLGYGIAFLYSFFKNLNFRLFLEKDKIEVKSGFFVRKRTSFKKTSVNDVKIEQTPLMRLIKQFSMKVSVGGYSDSKQESAVIIPCGRHGEIKRQFSLYFPFMTPDGESVHASRDRATRNRFFYLPRLYAFFTLLVSVPSMFIFKYFYRLILFISFVVMAVILYYANLCLYDYRFGKVRFGRENVYAKSSVGLHNCELCCPKERIGQIKLIRNPVDIRRGTCKVRITVRSESADSIRVRHLDYKTVKKNVYECYGIDE